MRSEHFYTTMEELNFGRYAIVSDETLKSYLKLFGNEAFLANTDFLKFVSEDDDMFRNLVVRTKKIIAYESILKLRFN